MIDEIRNTCILFIVLLFFVFFVIYYFNEKLFRQKEGLSMIENREKNPTYVIDAIPMNLDHTSLKHYKGKWNNSLTISSSLPQKTSWWWGGYESNISKATKENFSWKQYTCLYLDLRNAGIDNREKAWNHWVENGKNERRWIPTLTTDILVDENTNDVVTWNELPWKTNCTIENKNSDFSISFWIYINNPAWHWEHIFRVVDHYHTNRAPGIWKWCCNLSGLHIRQTADRRQRNDWWWSSWNSGTMWNEKDGWANESKKLNIPLQRPTFCTIVFSGKRYTLFVNGVKAHVHDHIGIPSPLSKRDCNHIQFGFVHERTSYALKDLNIYEEPLSDETAVSLYERIKDQGDREGAANFFGRTYGTDDCEPFSTQIQEGFSSLTKWFKRNELHTYEGFKTAVMLPEEYIFSDGEVFNYYNYKVKSYIKEKENEQTKQNGVFDIGGEDPTNDMQGSSSGTGNSTIPSTILNAHEYNLPSNRTLFYYNFDMTKEEYINVSKPIHFSGNGATFTMWFRASSKNWNWPRLFDFGAGMDKHNYIVSVMGRSLNFFVKDKNNNWHYKMWVLKGIVESWIHLSWVMNKDGTWVIYINGSEYTRYDNMEQPPTYLEGAPNNPESEREKIVRDKQYIGRSNWWWDAFYDGKIGDFRIFDEALSVEQIRYIYENPKDPTMSEEEQ